MLRLDGDKLVSVEEEAQPKEELNQDGDQTEPLPGPSAMDISATEPKVEIKEEPLSARRSTRSNPGSDGLRFPSLPLQAGSTNQGGLGGGQLTETMNNLSLEGREDGRARKGLDVRFEAGNDDDEVFFPPNAFLEQDPTAPIRDVSTSPPVGSPG